MEPTLALVITFISGLVGLSQTSRSDGICGKVSTYTAICRHLRSDTFFIVSANPCQSDHSISLTLVYPSQSYVEKFDLSGNLTQPLVYSTWSFGVLLEMHRNHSSDIRNYRDVVLYTRVYVVNSRDPHDVEDVFSSFFHLFPEACDSDDHGAIDRSNSLFNPQQPYNCKKAIRTGEFSTMCYNNPDPGDNSRNHFFLVATDPCTSPYSTVVVAAYQDGVTFVQAFTQSKLDGFVAVRDAKAANCSGIKVKVDYHETERYQFQHVTLLYGCPSNEIMLIDDYYHTELGMMCPLSNCTALNSTFHECSDLWISGFKDGRPLWKLARTVMSLNVCSRTVYMDYQLTLEGFPWTFSGRLLADHEEELHDLNGSLHLRLGPVTVETALTDGYVNLDGGEISLYVHEDRARGLIHTLILRHYPNRNDYMGYLHDEFWVKRTEVCSGYREHLKGRSNTPLAVGISIVVGAVALVLFGIMVLRCWRAGYPVKYASYNNEPDEEMQGVDSVIESATATNQ